MPSRDSVEVDVDLELIQRHSVELIADVKAVFEKCGITLWLDQGTLLGAIRERAFITWADDIDLGVWRADLDAKPEIWDDLRKAGFLIFFLGRIQTVRIERRDRDIGWRSIDLHPYDKLGRKSVKYFSKPKRIHLKQSFRKIVRAIDAILESKNGPDLRYRYIKEYIDGMTRPKDRIGFMTIRSQNSPLLNRFIQIASWILPNRLLNQSKHMLIQIRDNLCIEPVCLETPSHFFQDLDQMNFLGVQVRIPSHVTEYLRFKYGDDWQTPTKEWVYYEDDGAIKGPDGMSNPARTG